MVYVEKGGRFVIRVIFSIIGLFALTMLSASIFDIRERVKLYARIIGWIRRVFRCFAGSFFISTFYVFFKFHEFYSFKYSQPNM